MSRKQAVLGIMAVGRGPRFMEKSFYRKLTVIGRRLGFRVFVFSPRDVDFVAKTIAGYEYTAKEWQPKLFPYPDVIYDRCFIGHFTRVYHSVIEKLKNEPSITFLSNGLSGKWQVQKILEQSPDLLPYLPETKLFEMDEFLHALHEKNAVIIKPAAGTHGAGVMRVSKMENKYIATGRSGDNQPFHKHFKTIQRLKLFIQRITAARQYLLQEYLTLTTADQIPFDIRVLVQKNEYGVWETTGKAVRMGNRESITSNLHGGGKAVPLSTFLENHFPDDIRLRIETDLNRLIEILPTFLENQHGRLVELGIDVGIDQNGKVWLIEVNSRPGRNVFRQIADHEARLHSIMRPVKYAHYLMKERLARPGLTALASQKSEIGE